MFGASEATEISIVSQDFETENYLFEIIKTPGHSKDHQCFYVRNEGWLFSGDAFVAERIKYFRREENVYDQIISLRKLVQLDFEFLLCAHFPRKTNAKKALDDKLDYFSNVYSEVEHLWQQGLNSKEIMSKLSIREKKFIKYATFQDVSAEHLIKSAIASIKRGKSLS
jgi:glyoxylase-like metal-dependent hydrolase (beta-lactamase superfamily II)